MSPDARTPRPTRPAAPTSASSVAVAPLAIVSLLAHSTRLIDVLPELHQLALNATGGDRTLLFEHNPRNGLMQATSGFGLDVLPSEPWAPDRGESSRVADVFARRQPTLIPDARQSMPDLSARLDRGALLLLPLARDLDRIGMLTVGFTGSAPATIGDDAMAVADGFLMALELSRLRQGEELQRDLQQLLDDFTQGVAATFELPAGLDLFCRGAARLFGADRTSVWIHDRRARVLTLHASSDRERAGADEPVAANDAWSPAARAMHGTRAELVSTPGQERTSTVTVPLRGCRRALGAVVFEGVRVESGGELDLLNRADQLGHQLSNTIENLQLIENVMRSQRELEDTLDSIAHLVAVTDPGGRIVRVNKAFAARVGRTPDQLHDHLLSDFLGPDLGGWLAALARESAQGGSRPARRQIVDPVLNGPFSVTVTDLLNPARRRVGTVLVARDLAPQTRLEAEREELRRRVVQSEKLAALGQLVAGIAHELNNPLQGVLGHLELLRATGAFPSSLRREVRTIYREADRAARIVRNLLVFAGSGRRARRAVSLHAVIQKVLALRAPSCRAANIELVRDYDEKLPRLEGDPLLFHQVFLNMVMNAEHAVAAKGGPGRIEISTSAQISRGLVVITVRDSGCGIAPDALPRIFEPFYTTKEVGKGTGLGLAIVYGIVQDYGGAIHAANHPAGGAVFTVEFPLSDARRKVVAD